MLACHNVEVETAATNKSYLERLKSYFLAGEGWVTNVFKANEKGGWLLLERRMPGQLVVQELTHDKPGLVISRSALVAATPNVDIQVKYQGLSGIMKGKGLATSLATLAKGSLSHGRVYLNSGRGLAQAIPIKESDGAVIVDNDHIIGYTEGMTTTVRKLGNMKSLLLSGEGFVCEFKGNGVIYLDSGSATGMSNHATSTINEGTSQIYKQAMMIAVIAIPIIAVNIVSGSKDALEFFVRVMRE